MSKKLKGTGSPTMIFHIITLFPEIFAPFSKSSIIGRAANTELITINLLNLRNFAKDRHATVDDKPFGGGRGMVLKVDVVVSAIQSIKSHPYTILLSASGRPYNQKMAYDLSRKKSLTLVCGHYEGVDARVENFVDDVISIGDFVMTGGEIAAMAIVDSVTRLIPGAIAEGSIETESFSKIGNLLEYTQYTRPEEFRDLKVPKVLLSGNHKEIEDWRQKEALRRTRKFRPDLLKLSRKTSKTKGGTVRFALKVKTA